MALCTDSELRDGDVIGDPTEGALLVLAEKGGIDTAALRRDKPRMAEVPFDPDYKFMATFHRWTDQTGGEVVRCFVKGVLDVLAGMADRSLGGTGIVSLDRAVREGYARGNAELADPASPPSPAATSWRFQLSTALGFVITFLVASLTGIAGGAPFTALQVLFVNLVMDGPPAMSLGVDPVSPDAMRRPPRPARERILTGPRLLRILLASAVTATGTLLVLANAPGPEPRLGVSTVAGTMAWVTFVFFQVFNLLNVRNDLRSAFSRETLENRSAFAATAAVIVLLALIVEMDVLHGFFTVTDLTSGQWLACLAIGSAVGG